MLSELETKLLGVMMMVIMLGMGASLTFKDFSIALRKPAGVGIGLVTTYVLTPFVGYALALLLKLPPAYAVGLILMACLPGGTTSNIFNYFSKGVLSLSATGFKLSDCSYTVLVKTSATSAYFLCACWVFRSDSIPARSSSKLRVFGALMSVSKMMW